jgi:hypothetical protein
MIYFSMDANPEIPVDRDSAAMTSTVRQRWTTRCLVVLGVLGGLWLGLELPEEKMRPRLEQVKVGMTKRQIIDLLGESGDHRPYTPMFQYSGGGGGPRRPGLELWVFDDAELFVTFDIHGKAIETEVRHSDPYPASLLRKIQWHLGLSHH